VSAAFSPDGSQVLTAPFVGPGSFQSLASDNPAARLWDVATGRLRRELKHQYVQYAAFSPDGKRIVTVGFDAPTAVMWDAESGARLHELTDDGDDAVVSVAFSGDGRLFVTASKGDMVRVRTTADARTVGEFRVPGEGFMTGALMSPDGRRVLTVSSKDPTRLWDSAAASASPIAALTGHETGIDYAAFSPDSARLVTLAGDDHAARVWDGQTGRHLQSLEHEDFIGGAAFSSNSRLIATVSSDGVAALWDASNGRRLMNFATHQRSRSSVAFSPDGRLVATGTAWGQVLLESCEICGSASDLLARGKARVKRALTAEERRQFGIAGTP
jgi:WD40 repeat protein